MVEQTVLDERAGAQPGTRRGAPGSAGPVRVPDGTRTGTDNSPARGHRKGQRPVMPGWEDVLLGGGQTPNL